MARLLLGYQDYDSTGFNVPCAGGSPAYLEIDKLPDGTYRATVGTLFEHQEICRTREVGAAGQRDGRLPVLR